MKKFFQSKGFIVSSLALLCVTILGVCWFVSRDRTEDFRPDESPPSSVTGDWSDGGTQTDGDNGADAYAPGQSTDAEGICAGISTPMFRRYRKVHLIDSHGIEITLLLSKSALLKIGEPYRFYFQKGSRPVVGNDYLDAALSTNSFLGYEAISEPEEHPDPSSES